MSEKITFGAWLRQQRRILDLTQQTLADQAGCARITLRRIEADVLKPSKELALILLEKLGIPENDRPQWVQFARGLTGYPEQTPGSSPAKPLTNLPSLLTTFIGREKEQVEIIQHINKYRLVTLTGSGGVGKTRLSIKVGGQVLGDYSNGVWLLELAPLDDPAILPQTVAALFGLVTQSNAPLTEMLTNFLRGKTILLILDNCEHLLDASAQLTDTLLKNCPNLKILATSREPLGITGEALYRVPSLGLPQVEPVLEKFREFESVRLFEERAQLVQMDFSLTLENASFVAQICSRLDGIPLALELAAAKVYTLSANQIAEQLEESFNLLTGGSRTALPRQQTIRASINWSWGLLTESEQTFMRQLSIFAGGWTLESAQAVCDGDVLGLTSSLVKKSLIVMNQESGSEMRYHFHEVVRQYAREKLVDAGEAENVRFQHLKYFLKLSELAEPASHGPQQMEWFSRIHDERGNIRVALEQASRTDLETGLYLSGRLTDYWSNFDLREGLSWTTEFVQNPESKIYPHGRAKALLAQGNILWYLQQFDAALSRAEECIALFHACGDRQGEFEGLLLMGAAMQYLEGMERKVEIHKQALALAQSIDDVWRQALALLGLGWDQRDPRQSRANWEEAIALFRQVGDWRNLAFTLGILGYAVLSNGEIESAQKFLDESLEVNQRTNDKRGLEFALTGKSHMALMRGEYGQARAFLQEWMVLAEELGNRMGYLWARARLGYVALREGNVAEAHHILVEIVENFHKDRNKSGLAFALDKMASLCVVIDKPEVAARLIGWSDATREEIGDPRPRLEQTDVDRDILAIHAKFGKTAYEAAYAKGRAMTLDEAVAFALEEFRL
jgi:predicted ATPase/DNA-binding XRE family transcriptional regulator